MVDLGNRAGQGGDHDNRDALADGVHYPGTYLAGGFWLYGEIREELRCQFAVLLDSLPKFFGVLPRHTPRKCSF